jgi:hypothetical protein
MGFNSVFKGLTLTCEILMSHSGLDEGS